MGPLRVDCGRISTEEDKSFYCLNGGTCQEEEQIDEATNATRTTYFCQCPSTFTGTNCEQGIPCSLECLHGGRCRFRDRTQNISSLWNPWPGPIPSKIMHCDCPSGRGGHQCEYLADICGENEHLCLHGTKCRLDKNAVASSNEKRYYCECDSVDKKCHQRQPGQGQFCIPQAPGALEYYGGMSIPSFCFNGGKCVDVFRDGQWYVLFKHILSLSKDCSLFVLTSLSFHKQALNMRVWSTIYRTPL